jgi:hypothetical protein
MTFEDRIRLEFDRGVTTYGFDRGPDDDLFRVLVFGPGGDRDRHVYRIDGDRMVEEPEARTEQP